MGQQSDQQYVTVQMEKEEFYSLQETMEYAEKLIETTHLQGSMIALIQSAIQMGVPMTVNDDDIFIGETSLLEMAMVRETLRTEEDNG